jgi:hypothetical protein
MSIILDLEKIKELEALYASSPLALHALTDMVASVNAGKRDLAFSTLLDLGVIVEKPSRRPNQSEPLNS